MDTTRLSRTNDGILAGICSGIAKFLGWDVTLVRFLWLIFSCFGAGVIVYIILWIIMPKT